ncbi:MAG TPA: SDR family NAD(P)-dependent oxidoreductase, partial [Archangium sp.]
MSLYAMFTSKGPSGFGYASTAEDVTQGLDLTGTTYLVTGVNSGLGAETVRVLRLRGAKVLGAARTVEKAGNASVPLACELSDPKSVRACVKTVLDSGVKLDGLIANAGIMALPKLETAFGYELQFFTNHVGHFMLVTGLLDALKEDGRVVMLSSDAHKRAPKGGIQFDNLDGKRGYSPWGNYGQSKIANLLFAKELARRFAGSKRTANALHPGVIPTPLMRHMNPLLTSLNGLAAAVAMKTVPQGAATQVFVATHPSVSTVSGQYFADCNVARPRRDAEDPE